MFIAIYSYRIAIGGSDGAKYRGTPEGKFSDDAEVGEDSPSGKMKLNIQPDYLSVIMAQH